MPLETYCPGYEKARRPENAPAFFVGAHPKGLCTPFGRRCTPFGRLRRLPCATRQAGRLRNSGLRPSNSARRLPPARLRCSARHRGNPEHRLSTTMGGRNCDRFCSCPLRRRAAQGATGKGASSAAPRCNRAAQSTRRSRATQRARLLLGYFFLARQEEVPRLQAKHSASTRTRICRQGV